METQLEFHASHYLHQTVFFIESIIQSYTDLRLCLRNSRQVQGSKAKDCALNHDIIIQLKKLKCKTYSETTAECEINSNIVQL